MDPMGQDWMGFIPFNPCSLTPVLPIFPGATLVEGTRHGPGAVGQALNWLPNGDPYDGIIIIPTQLRSIIPYYTPGLCSLLKWGWKNVFINFLQVSSISSILVELPLLMPLKLNDI